MEFMPKRQCTKTDISKKMGEKNDPLTYDRSVYAERFSLRNEWVLIVLFDWLVAHWVGRENNNSQLRRG